MPVPVSLCKLHAATLPTLLYPRDAAASSGMSLAIPLSSATTRRGERSRSAWSTDYALARGQRVTSGNYRFTLYNEMREGCKIAMIAKTIRIFQNKNIWKYYLLWVCIYAITSDECSGKSGLFKRRNTCARTSNRRGLDITGGSLKTDKLITVIDLRKRTRVYPLAARSCDVHTGRRGAARRVAIAIYWLTGSQWRRREHIPRGVCNSRTRKRKRERRPRRETRWNLPISTRRFLNEKAAPATILRPRS